jgi:hypothetical protein
MSIKTRIVIKYRDVALGTEEFKNAELAIVAPGMVLIQDAQGELAVLPLASVAAILYPEGEAKVQL